MTDRDEPKRPPERPGEREFTFRRLEKPEEFRSAAELVRLAGTGLGDDPAPPSLQRAVQDHGGVVLGAFVDIHLAGVSVAFLGWDGATLYLYSHVLAVRPEYRNHAVGRRLKLRLRDVALGSGLGEIRFVFDPLESQQAYLNVHRLGAVPDRYLTHYYGRTGEAGEAGGETDRLRTVWRLNDPRVEARLRDGPPDRAGDSDRWGRAAPIVETETGESGLRSPNAVSEPTGPLAQLEVPFDLASLREHEPGSVRTWRHAVRDGFRAAFDLGYTVEEFLVVPIEHERRSFFLLRGPDRPSDPR